MTNGGGGIYAWIAWGMFSLVHKQVQKHYQNGHKKAKAQWGYGPAAHKKREPDSPAPGTEPLRKP